MLPNFVYDLMRQIVEESTSIDTIKKFYYDDCKDLAECSEVWDELVRDKEAHLEKLTTLLRKHL